LEKHPIFQNLKTKILFPKGTPLILNSIVHLFKNDL